MGTRGSEAHSSLSLCVCFLYSPLKTKSPPALQAQALPGLVLGLELATLPETKDTFLRGLFCAEPGVLTPGPPGSGARPFLAASSAVNRTPFSPVAPPSPAPALTRVTHKNTAEVRGCHLQIQ